MIKNNVNKFAIVYRLVDLVVIQLVLLLIITSYHHAVFGENYLLIALLCSMCFMLSAESFALYRSWRAGFFRQIAFYTFISCVIAASLVMAYLFFTKTGTQFSRITLGLWFVGTYASLIGWRFAFALFLKRIRAAGRNTRSVAIIGLGDIGEQLIHEIEKNPSTGYRIQAVFDDRSVERVNPSVSQHLQGSIKEGVERAKQNEFEVVYVALPMKAEERIQEILYLLGDTTATVHLVPNLFVYCLMSASMSHVGEMQTISVFDNPMQGSSAALKRAEDILISLMVLSVIAIPMLLISIAIKVTSPGPIIFKQDRYGLGGRKIKVWKFRSMTVTDNGANVVQAKKGDARITPVGAFLRKTSLDELPQFINVLKGDMSVVGPRPHAVSHNESYRKQVSYYMLRHKVKPGITGWAQVNGWRGETDTVEKMEMRVEYDLDYIKNWSLWMDFKIVLWTFYKGFVGKNVY
ncbi:undecaprenyl-phosphate glucose phosphotransferase [Reinekea marinisedimentorum]|nr:undecaprenyl-phosphate glucose phosphotransferase [Reinekea marinisedimentorum]